mmetsp:Transcript_93860/g.270415  ORF Transcript_93860/g.270415 Transcript_93860/m.270415 type:complete len:242 (+) Transcript_93860:2578-3303(+)
MAFPVFVNKKTLSPDMMRLPGGASIFSMTQRWEALYSVPLLWTASPAAASSFPLLSCKNMPSPDRRIDEPDLILSMVKVCHLPLSAHRVAMFLSSSTCTYFSPKRKKTLSPARTTPAPYLRSTTSSCTSTGSSSVCALPAQLKCKARPVECACMNTVSPCRTGLLMPPFNSMTSCCLMSSPLASLWPSAQTSSSLRTCRTLPVCACTRTVSPDHTSWPASPLAARELLPPPGWAMCSQVSF